MENTENANITSSLIDNDENFSREIVSLKEKTTVLLQRKFPNSCQQDREDAVQIASIKSYRFFKQFNGGSTFATWYTKIAINALLDILKKRSNQHIPYGVLTDIVNTNSGSGDSNFSSQDFLDCLCGIYAPGADELLSEEERLSEIRAAIAKGVSELKEKHARVFKLIFVEEKTYKDAAAELNIPIGTVMSQVHNIRRTLQSTISQELNYQAATNVK